MRSMNPPKTPLGAALRRLGIRRVLVVRHGNTNKAAVDSDRELTDKGWQQCSSFRNAFSAQLAGVSIVLSSPVARTMATARGICDVPATPVDDLYFIRPWRTPEMAAAESQLGYAPWATYHARFPGVHDAGGVAMNAAVSAALDACNPDRSHNKF